MKCEDCAWFALEPGILRTGACLHTWMPDVKVEGVELYGAFGRVLTVQPACEDFKPREAERTCKAMVDPSCANSHWRLCSECDEYFVDCSNYCPHCGARVVKGTDS